jgi:hypothetical protein
MGEYAGDRHLGCAVTRVGTRKIATSTSCVLHLAISATYSRRYFNLPKDYTGSLSFVVNDVDFDVVARNAILLLTALFLDTDQAVPAMTHLWYSVRLPWLLLMKV